MMSKSDQNVPTRPRTKIQTINPATEQVLKEYDIVNQEQIVELVKSARNEYVEWKKNINKRADHLY